MRAPIGIRIRRNRLKAGLSQAGLAKLIGISAAYLNLIENNKRDIGGRLLVRIGETLGIDLVELSGASEARSIQVVEELLAEPAMRGITMEAEAIRDLIGSFPEAGIALSRMHRNYRDALAIIEAYRHRLQSDPLLSEMLHQLVNRIAAIKSGAEILDTIPDLTEEESNRFTASIARESSELSGTVRNLADYFERTITPGQAATPMAELDEVIMTHGNYFPQLEALAEKLGSSFKGQRLDETELAALLARDHGVVCRQSAQISDVTKQYSYKEAQRELLFRSSSTASTRRFQMARVYALLAGKDVLNSLVQSLNLTSEDAGKLALGAFTSYTAAAMIMPYDRYLAQAQELRYDIDMLAHLNGASVEQAAHRLISLRRKGAEGLPFGFLRADRVGRLTKRFPIRGLTLPLSSYGCVLWPIYHTFGNNSFIRQIAEFPGGERFLLIAKATSKRAASYNDQPLTFSIMLACHIVHADRTVYGDDLNLMQAPIPVGPSCQLCPRNDCGHRQEG